MAAEGMQFLWWWNVGTIFAIMDVIWGMSVWEIPDHLEYRL